MESETRRTILLAEDDRPIRELLEVVLGARAWQVLAAANGEEALALARAYNQPIHLLLTDVEMPVLNGVDLARCLAGERPGMRVLLMSGSGYSDCQEAFPFLAKPFDVARLCGSIDRVMAGPAPASLIAA